MQSGSREYNGRNQYWTPSNIGLTQSMIDTSINKIELKDNTADLFTVENNKIKPTIAMVCETPTANEEIANKKYVDDKDLEVQRNMSSKYLTPTQATQMYASKSSVPKITYSHYYLYTTATSSGASYNKEITGITSNSAQIEISIPSSISGNAIFVSVNFRASRNSIDNSFLDKLACTLNSISVPSSGDVIKSTFTGCTAMGVPFVNGIVMYKFSLSQIFTDLPSSSKKVYLHFFYVENITADTDPTIVLPVTQQNPNVEITIVGI